MKGGEKVDEETKKPCTPVEEAGRDYNELGLYLHSRDHNQTLEAAQTLWEFLPGWMAARKMAVYETKEDKEMGKKNEAARMLANLNGPWSNAACMGYCLIAMRRANLRPGAQRRVLMVLEQCFDDVSVEDAEKAGYANTEG